MMSRTSSLPPMVFTLVNFSLLLSFPVLVLSIYNYGILSVFSNRFTTALTTLYHTCILASLWEQQQIPSGCPPAVIPRKVSIFYRSRALALLALLVILNFIAFSMTLQVTIEGPESLNPAERVYNMGGTWNLRIQIAQSSLLGIQLLILSALVVLCVVGRNHQLSVEKDAKEAKDCGLESQTSSESDEIKA